MPAPERTCRRIAIIGAPGTGKTQLAGELAQHLAGRGLRVAAVPDVLHGRSKLGGPAPRPQEQLAIAREQEERVDAAAGKADLVIADTTALMVAIQAGVPDEDGALHRFALERQRRYDATLITGLDLPWRTGGLQRDAGQPREAVDGLLRMLLQRAGAAFQVVYGQGPQRLQAALQALAAAGVLPPQLAAPESAPASRRPWVWACDKCSDPECEHRLFAQLRENRG